MSFFKDFIGNSDFDIRAKSKLLNKNNVIKLKENALV